MSRAPSGVAGAGDLAGAATHLFVSPHPDDAAVSCGGTIARLTESGADVTIITACAASHPGPPSPVATAVHRLCGDPDDLVAVRRAEDRSAAAVLGTRLVLGPFQDAIYRTGRDNWLYGEHGEIFGPVHPAERGMHRELASLVAGLAPPGARIYCPLGVGGHVDHLIAAAAGVLLAETGHEVWHYEDLFYAMDGGARRRRLLELPPGAAVRVAMEPRHLRRKENAVLEYSSQLEMICGGGARAGAMVRDAAALAGDGIAAEAFRALEPAGGPPG